MRMSTILIFLTCVLASFADELQIISYTESGELRFRGATTGNYFTLEFTGDLNGPWTNWGSVVGEPIDGAVMSVTTPMFFRIREIEPHEVVDLRRRVDLRPIEVALEVVQLVGIRLVSQNRRAVKRLKRATDYVYVILEIQNEHVVFLRVCPVEARQGLDRLDA